jgi:hypothetical protein
LTKIVGALEPVFHKYAENAGVVLNVEPALPGQSINPSLDAIVPEGVEKITTLIVSVEIHPTASTAVTTYCPEIEGVKVAVPPV